MASTILIKFIVLSTPNNMILSIFSKKSMKLDNYFLIFCPSPTIAPKPTGQFRSHSISRVPLQIYLARFFVFDIPSKLKVVHIRKKFKILIFSKMAPTIFIRFCGFIVHSNPNNTALSAFSGKILVTRIIFFNFLSVV